MGVVLILIRSIVFIVMTLGCTITVLLFSWLFGHRFALRTQQFWSRVMLWTFGVKTVMHGERPEVGLMMSNHRSYLDIWLIPKYAITVFVAKAEVEKMPLLGWGASVVDTVYVDRSNKESRRATKNEIAERIRKGRSVIIFPEGTTGDGNGLLPLKPGMFHVAAEEGFPIIPVAIFYENPDLAWVGDDNMGAHFYRNFTKLSTTAHIVFGKPMTGSDGEDLLDRYRSWAEEELMKLKSQT